MPARCTSTIACCGRATSSRSTARPAPSHSTTSRSSRPEVDPRFDTVLGWCDELRRLEVRANADTPEDARRARGFGAAGIGLCRTEHMFMAADRQQKMQSMIMADDEAGRRAALDQLLPLQQGDFEGMLEAMEGLPVTIRLLDPPLHEFMPDRFELVERITEARLRGAPELGELEHTLERMRALEEGNPMLGTRGVRLGLVHPEIYEMQARAIFRAARAVHERTGRAPRVEIMIPLVAYARELELARDRVVRVGVEEGVAVGRDFSIGTMIELPRACFVAGEVARACGVLLLRDQRPHPDRTWVLARRHRGANRSSLRRHRDRRALPLRDDRRAGCRRARADRRAARSRGPARAGGRRLWRARGRRGLDPLLPRGRARLRQLLAVPRADRAGRSRAGGYGRLRRSWPRASRAAGWRS